MRKNTKLERFRAGAETLPTIERAAMYSAMVAARGLKRKKDRDFMLAKITGILAARGRFIQKSASDRRTDAARRRLVGARLPKDQAERCRACAALKGVSLYRFTVDALDTSCALTERLARVQWDGEQHVSAGAGQASGDGAPDVPSSSPIVQRR